MKLVKKLVLALACLAMSAVAAYAEGDIAVTYNSAPLSFADVKPVIIDGRTMLPFRSVFEQMGAQVDYDDSTRTAKAVFGGREISFSLDGTEIYAEGSSEPVYVMDVPPTIVQGRTLVPVRAVAEAGGLTVGWDNAQRTVNVIDRDAVIKELKAACPGIEKLKALFAQPARLYNQKETLKLTSEGMSVTMTAVSSDDGENQSGSAKIDINLESDMENWSIRDITVDTVTADGAVYLKTNLIEKIKEADPSDAESAALALIFPDKWFKADLGELENLIAGNNSGFLENAAAQKNTGELIDAMLDYYIGEASGIDMINPDSTSMVNTVFENVIEPFKESIKDAVKVTENPDGTADVEITAYTLETEGTEAPVTVKNTFKATYYNGVPLSMSLSWKENGLSIEAEGSAEVGGMVEKISVPENAENFVDAVVKLIELTEQMGV